MASYFVTGTSRGIGLQLVTSLATRPSTQVSKVFASARKESDGLRRVIEGSNGRVQFVPLEITSQESVEGAVRIVEHSLNGQGLDILINNAAVGVPSPNGILDMKDLSEHLNTNVIGVHNVTAAFLPLIRKGNLKKVINISSSMGSLTWAAHFDWQPTPAYKISKTALNMLTVQYASEFRGEGFTFVAICPGWVKTETAGGDIADLTPEKSIAGILELADKVDIEDSGKLLSIKVPGWEMHENPVKRYDGSVRPW